MLNQNNNLLKPTWDIDSDPNNPSYKGTIPHGYAPRRIPPAYPLVAGLH